MTTSQNAHPIDQPVSFSQAKAAEAEASVPEAKTDDRVFKLGRKSWPLVASVSFSRSANIQKALNEFDLLALADQLPSLVLSAHREELKNYLLADTESDSPDHVTMPDVIDAWTSVQEVIAQRPFDK
jgi:hypothetical protein